MNIMKRIFVLSIALSTLRHTTISAMSLSQPTNTLLRPPYDTYLPYHADVFLEAGYGLQSFNAHDKVCNALQIWQPYQNGLAMLKGACPDTAINDLSNRLNANDDGVRGTFTPHGDLRVPFASALHLRFYFLTDWFVSLHFPMYRMTMRNLRFVDRTENFVDADYRVKTMLTEQFASLVRELGGIQLRDWQRTGFGDCAALLNWYRNFPQNKEILTNARINWRVGLTFPTGKRNDLDLILALPFGYDGAFSLPFGVGLDLMFGNHVQAGLDVQLTHIFGSTSFQRIKTDPNQTDLLFLHKACVYTDYGLTQRFNLYAQLCRIFHGFSFLAGYQFVKHGTDHIALQSNIFSSTIANSAESLKEWTSHHIELDASYDFTVHTRKDSRIQPYIAAYVRIPVNGKRFTGSKNVGLVLSIDF